MQKSTYKMNKITYLFGAGASKHALPIVNEIPDRILKLIDLLESDDLKLDEAVTFAQLNIPNQKNDYEYQKELINSLRWMYQESKNHASIDTFAKKLFIKNESVNLKRLKIAMSIFFIFEQALNKPDSRYDSFYSAILNNSIHNLPKNINILSWNYDYQFELAFTAYSNQFDIDQNNSMLRVKSKHGDTFDSEGFGIYKLNGTTGMYDTSRYNNYYYTNNLHNPIGKEFIKTLTRNYVAAIYLRNIESTLSFAWETEYPRFNRKGVIESAIASSLDSVALVIIGYSFPFFNREIDRKIIGNMTKLKRVYIQAPDADILVERFKAIRDDLTGIEILPKYDLGQFVLPNEL